MRLFFILLLAPMAVLALDLTDQQRADIEARIQPFYEVCVEGEACGGGDAMATNAGRSGEDVYNGACMACHSAGIAGAPKVGDQLAWTDRIAKGMDVLYDSGINGVAGTGMIARGGCADCSDDEIRLAVDFMVEGSR
ncbi:MAG: cellulose-binding protein [Halieaceae bacterium]|jgi:cytochrome c5|nr:cellulose-binding protein [Halieaceae bacterium]MDG1931065.1 c-type cytochrome [Luminiphilus sp.]MDG2037041.1 c-type cytochrome [Luminiphilus sp.]|tara:strand:- start:3237 stop:3647 length:411 start_codon:yes stop_codon:yes gene_type:complete